MDKIQEPEKKPRRRSPRKVSTKVEAAEQEVPTSAPIELATPDLSSEFAAYDSQPASFATESQPPDEQPTAPGVPFTASFSADSPILVPSPSAPESQFAPSFDEPAPAVEAWPDEPVREDDWRSDAVVSPQVREEKPFELPFVPVNYVPETPAETVRQTGLAYTVGIVFFVTVAFMLFLGWLADLLLGTSPWGIVFGVIVGSVIGFIQFFRISSQIHAPRKDTPRPLLGDDDNTRPL